MARYNNNYQGEWEKIASCCKELYYLHLSATSEEVYIQIYSGLDSYWVKEIRQVFSPKNKDVITFRRYDTITKAHTAKRGLLRKCRRRNNECKISYEENYDNFKNEDWR